MKKIYIKPTTLLIPIEPTNLLMSSTNGKYDIGGGNSKYPKAGEIIDDHGDGPGVSGAKGCPDFDMTEDINDWK